MFVNRGDSSIAPPFLPLADDRADLVVCVLDYLRGLGQLPSKFILQINDRPASESIARKAQIAGYDVYSTNSVCIVDLTDLGIVSMTIADESDTMSKVTVSRSVSHRVSVGWNMIVAKVEDSWSVSKILTEFVEGSQE